MNAKEAHARAKEQNTNDANSQYARAKDRIELYARGGKYQCCFYEPMLDDVRDKLEKERYTIGENQNDKDGSYVQIGW